MVLTMEDNNKTAVETLKQTVLIVDDDLPARMLMRASLIKGGFQVIEAQNGIEAVDQFINARPDAILMDVMMPELDGFGACRAIRNCEGGEHIPILMVTGLEDIESINRAYDSGSTDFITKPINWTLLNYRVKYMLRATQAFFDVIDKQKKIQELAFFDHLTGLANRTLFKETLTDAVAASLDNAKLIAVLFLDIDRFKTINDTLGHHIGDLLLKSVAGRISTAIKEADALAQIPQRHIENYISRQGGDEFSVMIPNLHDPEQAGRLASRINDHFSETFHIEGHEIFVSSSIGISIYPLDGYDAEELIKNADLAMYHAKERGKNCFQYYKKDLNIKAHERLEFENDVRKGVAREEFELYFQPQINMADGSIVGAEALTRWFHKERGFVSPAQFIPLIEELGLIEPFTDWVIRSAAAYQRDLIDSNIAGTNIAINISSKQFVQQEIPAKIQKVLQQHDLSGEFLELELTESVLARQNSETMDILHSLKEMGLSISVDDFGTGYSSLVYLKSFPIDIVKIDRFFIQDICTSVQDASIVRAIIAMAKSMDMAVIAEGIETKEQYAILRDMGCDIGQGYLFSRPVPGSDFKALIEDGKPLSPV